MEVWVGLTTTEYDQLQAIKRLKIANGTWEVLKDI